jgi:hypothetical protein
MRFVFNDGNQGWHCAWQGHRMTGMTRHQLRITVLAGSNRRPGAPPLGSRSRWFVVCVYR